MDPQKTIEAATDRLMEVGWQDPRVEAVLDEETYELTYKLKAFGELDMHDTHLEAVLDWQGNPKAVWVGDGFRGLWMPLPVGESDTWDIPGPEDTDALFSEWLRQIVAAHQPEESSVSS